MHDERRNNISRKLIFGFGWLIIIFVLYQVYTLYEVHTISKLTRTIYDHPLVVSNASLQANVSITKMHRNMKDVVLFESDDRIQKSIAAVDAQEQIVYQELDLVRNRILGDEGKRLVEETRTLFDDWRPIREEVIALVQAGKRNEAAEITIGKGANHVAALEEKMLSLTNYARNKAASFMDESRKVSSRLNTLSILLFCIAICTFSLIAFITLKSVARSEKALSISEQRYRKLFEYSPIPLWEEELTEFFSYINNLRQQGIKSFREYFENNPLEVKKCTEMINVLEINQAAVDLHQAQSKNELLSNLNNIFTARSFDAFKEELIALAEGQTEFEIEGEVKTLAGEPIEIFLVLLLDEKEDGLMHALLATIDITERKTSERELKRQRDLFELVINSVPARIYWKDLDLIYMGCNYHFARDAGYENPEDIVGKDDYEMVWKKDAEVYRGDDRSVITTGEPKFNYEELFFNKEGQELTWLTNKMPLENIDGKTIGVIAISENITDKKAAEKDKQKLEAQLQQSQKMESIGTLAGGIAHDFNNILSSVIGFTELSLEEVKKGSKIEENLLEVHAAGLRAKELVKQILAFARQSSEEIKPIQPKAISEEIIRLLRSSIPTTIKINQQFDSESYIMGNPIQLHQILMNLCTNAAYAMEGTGGQLTITIQDVEIEQIPVSVSAQMQQSKHVQLRISDTGKGISPEIINSIFDPYFTTKPSGEGTGMGLAMVQGIVESYGGRIVVESKLGEGTTFTTYLPICNQQQSQSLYTPKSLPNGSERILFVDDETSIARMGGRMLGSLGYKVTTKSSSNDALNLFREKPEEFDLVITDMTMPDMTGDVLAIEINKINPDTPVIVSTGYSTSISEKKADVIGIKALIYKPFLMAELAGVIRKVLDNPKTTHAE